MQDGVVEGDSHVSVSRLQFLLFLSDGNALSGDGKLANAGALLEVLRNARGEAF